MSSVGGLLGAMAAPKVSRVLGARRTLLFFGFGRTVWLLPLPLAGNWASAFVVVGASQFMMLLFAAVFNPAFTTFRMNATPDSLMARVSAAWSVSAKSIQPLFIAVGGVLATWSSPRWSLGAAGILCVASAAFLPWKSGQPESL
jgi:hypothetical protein